MEATATNMNVLDILSAFRLSFTLLLGSSRSNKTQEVLGQEAF